MRGGPRGNWRDGNRGRREIVNNQRSGWRDSSRGEYNRGAPRGSWRGRGNLRPAQNKEPLKFENDYDFEEANAKFDKEAIDEELKKLNISKFHYFVKTKFS